MLIGLLAAVLAVILMLGITLVVAALRVTRATIERGGEVTRFAGITIPGSLPLAEWRVVLQSVREPRDERSAQARRALVLFGIAAAVFVVLFATAVLIVLVGY